MLAAGCGGLDRSIETAMAENEPLFVIDLTEPTGSSSTKTPPPVDDRPLSQGQDASRAAKGRIASDGTPTFDGDFANPFLLPHEGDFYAYVTNTLFMNVPVMASYCGGPGGMVGDALPALPAWSEPHHVWPRRAARSTAPTSSTRRPGIVRRVGSAFLALSVSFRPVPSSMHRLSRSCAPSTWVIRSI